MDLDKTLLDLVLTKGKIEAFVDAGLAVDDLQGPSKQVFAYVLDYWKNPRYKGALPSVEMVKRKFPEYELPKRGLKQDIVGVLDEIRRRSLYNLMRDGVNKIAKLMKEDKTSDAASSWHQFSSEILSRQAVGRITDLSRNSAERWLDYEQRRDGTATRAIPTGFPFLDRHLSGGWQPSDYILLIAKSGTGKTWFLTLCAIAAQMSGERCLLVSREMANRHIMIRYDAIRNQVSYERFRRGQLTKSEEKAYKEYLAKSSKEKSVFLYEQEVASGGLCTPSILHAKARELGCRVILIDGVYLLDSDAGITSSWEKHFDIASGIRAIGRSDGTIVVATNQMNAEEDPREATMDNSAFGKVYGMFCDVGMKMFRGKDERLQNEMLFQLLKTREESLPLRPFRVQWDFDEMAFSSMSEAGDGDSDALPPSQPDPTDMVF